MTESKRKDFIEKATIAILGVMMTAGVLQISLTATLSQRLKQAEERIDTINRDYTPFFVVDAIIESNHYRADEIIAAINKDPEKVLEIQKKYNEMQSTLIKRLSDLSRTRSGTLPSTNSRLEP